MKAAYVLTALCVAITAEVISYEGYKVFEIHPATEQDLIIMETFKTNPSFDFWSAFGNIGTPTTVMVAPEAQVNFTNVLDERKIQYSVMIENFESTITAERTRQRMTRRVYETEFSFTKYNRYYEIQNYLTQLAQKYPNIVSLENIGTSYEGRNLSMIKIESDSSTKKDKPIILIEGGIHAREWISPAVVTYIIKELVENENNRNLIGNTDWYIIPVLNPDGYEYTHTVNRMWRKTRSSSSTYCPLVGYKSGVDANRNFGFHWGDIGADHNPCSGLYVGPNAFSEPETSALRDVVIAYKDRIKLYVTFHSFAQYLLYPWAYTYKQPDNVRELHALAQAVEAAIGKRGTRYAIGTVPALLRRGPATGSSFDWVKAVGGVELSYAFELPAGGQLGFDLEASRILNISFDIFEGMKVYQNYIAKKFAIRN